WLIQPVEMTLLPYDIETAERLPELPHDVAIHMWCYRASLKNRRDFGQLIEERGLSWYEHSMFFPERFRRQLGIAFAFVATHNHFVLDRGGKVFNRTAPVIKLPAGASEDDHLGLLGLLNSTTACFWLKQVCANKGLNPEPWTNRFEHGATKVGDFPLI